MEWLAKNNFTKWLIGVLLAVNILTSSIIWIYVVKESHQRPFAPDDQRQNPAGLIQKQLNLSAEQTKQFDKMRKENFEKTNILFDQIFTVKKQLSNALFNEKIDTVYVNSLISKQCSLQTELEKLRFNHFKEFISVCTPEQKQKLRPILSELISGKPPMEGMHGKNEGIMPPPLPQGPAKDVPTPSDHPERL